MSEVKVGQGEASNFTSFLNNNKRLVVLLCILLVVIILAVVINVVLSGNDTDNQLANVTNPSDQPKGNGITTGSDDYAEVLPQMERTAETTTDQAIETSGVPDPFLLPKELLGIIIGGGGEDLAIVGTGEGTYLVEEGQLVNDLWEVKEINDASVVLVLDDRQLVLKLNPVKE